MSGYDRVYLKLVGCGLLFWLGCGWLIILSLLGCDKEKRVVVGTGNEILEVYSVEVRDALFV